MHHNHIAHYLINLLLTIPIVFSVLFYLLINSLFAQAETRDLFIFYCGGLWLICSPALILETYRRKIRDESKDRAIYSIIMATCTAIPTLALALTPAINHNTFTIYFYVALCGIFSGTAGAFFWSKKTDDTR